MREKKSVREGLRTGMKMPNNVKRNSDGIEDVKDYFKNTDDEDDDTTNLETEESEMQGTLPSYNINYTGVFLESDSTETSVCPLIYRKPLGNSSKYVKDVGKKSLRRKSHGTKKKSFSKKKQSAPFQYSDSDSDSSYEEKTYVDKSVVTSPVSFPRASLPTPGIGFSRTVAESPNLKSKGVKASSSSRSIMVEPQRNISTTSIGRRDQESRILRSGNTYERVNLTGRKSLSESRRGRGSRQHKYFSSARNRKNCNDRREAIYRKIPSPNLNTSKSQRELNRSRTDYNQNSSGIPQATVVNDCEISLLNRSKSGRTINSPGQNGSRHSEFEMVVSPLKRGKEQRSDISMCDLQNRKTNTSLELNRSKSGGTPLLIQTSPRNESLRRTHKPRSPSKLVQNAAMKDDRNPEVSEGSQMLGSMERKRNSSPRKEQGQEELEDQEIINDEDENNISPRRRLIETSTQKTDSRVHRCTSGAKESNHLPKTKKLVGRKKNLKIKGKASSPTPYLLARPQRTRIRPLAYWKGEYRTFRRTKDGDIVLAEMNLVDSPSIRIPKKVVKTPKIEDDVISEQEQLYLNEDEATGKYRKLVGVHQELDWIAATLGSDPVFRVALTGFTKNFTSGYLELDINGTKEELSKLTLNFVVMEGIVRFSLRDRDGSERAVNVGRRNSMIVPRRIFYSLANCYAEKSLLYFHSIEEF